MSLNYHTLADFCVAHGDFLDKLLTHSVTLLLEQGLVTLERVAQDSIKVRASAGASAGPGPSGGGCCGGGCGCG